MQAEDRFAQLMQQFAETIDLDEPALSEDGLVCRMAFPDSDQIVTISCHPGEEALFFFTALDPLEQPLEQKMHYLLVQNLFGGGTHNVHVGLDSHSNTPVLFKKTGLADADAGKLIGMIENLLEVARRISSRLAHIVADAAEPRHQPQGEALKA